MSVSNVDLMEGVCHSTNKIYREMLRIIGHEGMSYITMDELNHDQVSAFKFSSIPHNRIALSCDLLDWISLEDGIPYSFTNFITTQEFSGLLYISPDIYQFQ